MTDYASKAHFGVYNPALFGWGGKNDPMKHPKLLVPFRHSGAYYGLMHRDAVPFFTAVFNELVPKIPGGIAGKKDEGCYNPASRTVGGDRSFHTYAIATDTNWSDNGMYQKHKSGDEGVLPDATKGIVRKYGGEWGGTWTYPQDWMHIELHLSPADARKLAPLRARALRKLTVRSSFPFKTGHYFGDIDDPSVKVHGGVNALERDYGRLIHVRLMHLGYMTLAQAKKDGSGVIGHETVAAIKRWQKRRGRKPTGRISKLGYRYLMSPKAPHARSSK